MKTSRYIYFATNPDEWFPEAPQLLRFCSTPGCCQPTHYRLPNPTQTELGFAKSLLKEDFPMSISTDDLFFKFFEVACFEGYETTCETRADATRLRFAMYSWRTKKRRARKLMTDYEEVVIQLRPEDPSKPDGRTILTATRGGSTESVVQTYLSDIADRVKEEQETPSALDLIQSSTLAQQDDDPSRQYYTVPGAVVPDEELE